MYNKREENSKCLSCSWWGDKIKRCQNLNNFTKLSPDDIKNCLYYNRKKSDERDVRQ